MELDNSLFLACSRYRRRKFKDTETIASKLLEKNALDQAAWYMKCQSMWQQTYIDDTELEDEGIGDSLMDENALSTVSRPGTSLFRPLTGVSGGSRPISSTGRPMSGFARPGTMGGVPSGGSGGASRPLTSSLRPVTQSGRYIRIGTQSMLTSKGSKQFIEVDRLDLKRYAQKLSLAKALFQYLLFYENNSLKAMELATFAIRGCKGQDWWWMAQLGKCYYRLGLVRDAETMFLKALAVRDIVDLTLWLCKCYIRFDQPQKALQYYTKALEKWPGETFLLLAIARIHEAMNNTTNSVFFYRKAVSLDGTCVEGIACLGAHHFYADQPEIALRFYRRLLQIGVNNAELWANIALSCFYAQQYDISLQCFRNALLLAEDTSSPDIWYNIGMVSISVGDLQLAYQTFKICLALDPSHPEALNNMGILELQKGNVEAAKSSFDASSTASEFLFEPLFGKALLSFKLGHFQDAHSQLQKALTLRPDNPEANQLLSLLDSQLQI